MRFTIPVLVLLYVGTAVSQEGDGIEVKLGRFLAQVDQPKNWVYRRFLYETDNAFPDSSVCTPGVDGGWGYTGGNQNSYRNYEGNGQGRDIFLQAKSSLQQQNIVFRFCEPVVVKSVYVTAAHTGHNFIRGSLERRSDFGWVNSNVATIAKGPCGMVKTQTCDNLQMTNNEGCSTRWRVHDWRTNSNQWLSGTDLVVEKCAYISPIGDINSTLHGRIDELEKTLREEQQAFATRGMVADVADALDATETNLVNTTQHMQRQIDDLVRIVNDQQRQIVAANLIRDQLSSRLEEVEFDAAFLAESLTNFTTSVATFRSNVNVPPPNGVGAGSHCQGCVPTVTANAFGMKVTGDHVSFETSTCDVSAADICVLKQSVQALLSKFDGEL